MNDAATTIILQEIIRRESRSFLQYVGDTFPWVADEDRTAFLQLQQVIAEQTQGIAELGRFLTRRRAGLPYLGSYPTSFTTWNFVSVQHLLPRLIDDERRGIDALNRDLARIGDPEARAAVENYLALKKRHLQTLEGMMVPSPQPAAVA